MTCNVLDVPGNPTRTEVPSFTYITKTGRAINDPRHFLRQYSEFGQERGYKFYWRAEKVELLGGFRANVGFRRH